jgi:hypothetical protein
MDGQGPSLGRHATPLDGEAAHPRSHGAYLDGALKRLDPRAASVQASAARLGSHAAYLRGQSRGTDGHVASDGSQPMAKQGEAPPLIRPCALPRWLRVRERSPRGWGSFPSAWECWSCGWASWRVTSPSFPHASSSCPSVRASWPTAPPSNLTGIPFVPKGLAIVPERLPIEGGPLALRSQPLGDRSQGLGDPDVASRHEQEPADDRDDRVATHDSPSRTVAQAPSLRTNPLRKGDSTSMHDDSQLHHRSRRLTHSQRFIVRGGHSSAVSVTPPQTDNPMRALDTQRIVSLQ